MIHGQAAVWGTSAMIATAPPNKQASRIYYASTDEGVELPVLDITNPAFAVEVSEAALPAFAATSLRSLERWSRIPGWLRRRLARRSLLLGESAGEPGTFVSGITTYLLKLGPEQLVAACKVGNMDRRAAGAISSVAVRLRLRAVARLLADGLLPLLAGEAGRPLHLFNLGGGTATDSLNTLILVQREQPQLLGGRQIRIHVLDLDLIGPAFGARLLAALLVPGARWRPQCLPRPSGL